uniref:Uncharacterized protein n=1 Tax=Romanomermis culicivorax TaxID=13658 RepID=A0A915JIR8_ROMCU
MHMLRIAQTLQRVIQEVQLSAKKMARSSLRASTVDLMA